MSEIGEIEGGGQARFIGLIGLLGSVAFLIAFIGACIGYAIGANEGASPIGIQICQNKIADYEKAQGIPGNETDYVYCTSAYCTRRVIEPYVEIQDELKGTVFY